MPSPYGRELDTEQDTEPEQDSTEPKQMEWGYTGGDTRFQLICRAHSLHKPIYPGANWHEREAREMFGVTFDEHPDLRNIYLPGDFEGHPLRKDYPLLSRRMKPWPGIVDVEAMPGEEK